MLPSHLYTAAQTRQLDEYAIASGVAGYELMTRAAQVCVDTILQEWEGVSDCVVVCGAGNNAGDGYVIARLLRQLGVEAVVVAVGDPAALTDDAKTAYQDAVHDGVVIEPFEGEIAETQVIVDALLGIGLSREVGGEYLAAINAMNHHDAVVLSVDVPSGLDADTGMPQPVAVIADVTVTMIAVKQGLMTGEAGDYCGRLLWADLSVPNDVARLVEPSVQLLNESWLPHRFIERDWSSHKYHHGHVVVVGGNHGMAGAALMAAQAALRSGAGLVSVFTRPEHVGLMVSRQPELMVKGIDDTSGLHDELSKADVIVLGPGLGQDEWARVLWMRCLEMGLPTLLDADALTLLAQSPRQQSDWVITPHAGEASRLLGCSSQDVQQDRFAAAKSLEKISPVSVLKGAGTLVQFNDETLLCPYGNPGMAVGGMGDVLSGVVAGFWAQGMTAAESAELGVLIHALAGDRAAQSGQRGLLPTDLLPHIRTLVNP